MAGGPGAQRNKGHKAGRRAGKSAREKHRDSKSANGRLNIKSGNASMGKAERANAAKQLRDKKRAELIERKRAAVSAPIAVALFPLSSDVDIHGVWSGLVQAFQEPSVTGAPQSNGGMEVETHQKPPPSQDPMTPITLALPDRKKVKFTLLPALTDRSDLLAVVDVMRAAEVVLFIVAGSDHSVAIDGEGHSALAVVRAIGLPTAIGLVQSDTTRGATVALKERSAAKKRGTDAFDSALSGDRKIFVADTAADYKQIVRHMGDNLPVLPHWRQQRPQIAVMSAETSVENAAEAGQCSLALTGHVRNLGLSANQLVHVPGAGDFQIDSIEVLSEPIPVNIATTAGNGHNATMEIEATHRLVHPDPSQQESLQRLNIPDPLEGEQTWPTEEELAEAAALRGKVPMKKRRLPKGTSEYQAAWILDEDSDLDGTDLEEESDDDEDMGMGGTGNGSWEGIVKRPAAGGTDAGTEFDYKMDDGDDMMSEENADDESDGEETYKLLRARRDAEDDDVKFPDEVEVPLNVPARERFARYRGLKSFRTSPWDPREDLPPEYAKVFAFENFKRAHKRAVAASLAAGSLGDAHGVAAGSYVCVVLKNVPVAAAATVVERVQGFAQGAAAPFSVWGLLQHESKLSVLNFAARKAATYKEPLANKEELLFVSGPRAYLAKPIYSSDEHGADKFKMERFLHEGRSSVGTIYGPISYPPQPLLAFKMEPSGRAVLAATGHLKSCNPDRVVIKKIVLTGYPVRCHKSKAVVRFMFHNPDDIRWFKPVELWTNQGRRGRIREPVGTHGTMKCIFDGPLSQQDAVCMSLYKRVFPKEIDEIKG